MASPRKLALWWDTEEHGCNQASASCVEKVAVENEFEVTRISSCEIAQGKLSASAFHCFCMGGGELSARQALGPRGYHAIRAFVAGGGGYVGFCLGALMACDEDFHIVNLANIGDGGGANGGLLSGCLDGSFCDHHKFGDPEDRTWMVSGYAKLAWVVDTTVVEAEVPLSCDSVPADDGAIMGAERQSPRRENAPEAGARPENVLVSHPPVFRRGGVAPENTEVDVLATFAGDQTAIEFVPLGPKCPITEERFRGALVGMCGQIAVASGKHGCGRVFVTGTHPEMTSGSENAELVAHMLGRVSGTSYAYPVSDLVVH